MLQKTGFTLAVLFAMLALRIPATGAALAAPAIVTFTVTSSLDVIDDSAGDGQCHTAPTGAAAGACTLRAAVMEANRASGAGATIILPAGSYTLTIPAAGLGGDANGDLDLTTPSSGYPSIQILGAGADRTIIDGNQIDRVLVTRPSRIATISGLNIRHGYSVGQGADAGAGISNFGELTVVDSVISDNVASRGGAVGNMGSLTLVRTIISNNSSGTGGGIENVNFGTLTVIHSTVSHNWANGAGGGILNYGSLNMNRSTISNNSAWDGGAIANVGFGTPGSIMIGSSTLSQNNAAASGGGISNSGTANVYNTTIIFNQADSDADYNGFGGGIYNNSGATFNVRNVMLAGNNVSNAPVFDDCRGIVGTYGLNLIGTDAASVKCSMTFPGLSAYLNSLSLLGPLQNNGGPTWTHALLAGSNAIDGGDPVQGCIDEWAVPLTTDQRGAARSVGVRCDIGAFEYRPPLYLPIIRR